MDKASVLFVCVQNTARSQMAEAFLRELAGDRAVVASAGLRPAEQVNPLVVAVMAELGLDISGQSPKSVFDLFRAGRLFEYVISVCDDSLGEQCPVFPGMTTRLHWSFPDPAVVTGFGDDQRARVRAIRDDVRARVREYFGPLFPPRA